MAGPRALTAAGAAAAPQWRGEARPARTGAGELFDSVFVRLVTGFVLLNWVARWLARALSHQLYGVCDRVASWWGGSYADVGYPRLPETIALIVVPTALYWAFVHFAERRRVKELGGGWRGVAEGSAGLLLGAGLFAVIAGVLAVAGAYHVVGHEQWVAIQWSLPAAAVAFREEQLFRGVVQRISEERLGSWGALALAALVFGLMHTGNPNAGLFDGLMIALFGGVLLGACYLATRRLWLAIGVHAAWNLVEGGVFGTRVSGFDIPGLLRSVTKGARWLTGGAFGPESSLVTLAVCTAASVTLLLIARRRGYLLPARLTSSRAAGTART